MSGMTPRERLRRAAHGEETDRPPCICPGGMMNAIIRDIMERTGCSWPESHSDPQKMAALTLALYRAGGFENCGVPFCMTVEAEAMGATVDMGDMETEPHVVDSPLNSTEEVDQLTPLSLTEGRAAVVIEAIRLIRAEEPDAPIVGNITGPISTAGTLIDMSKLLIESRKKPEACHKFIDRVSEELIRFAQAQADAGADAICLAEPSGTGEILGAKLFEEYTVHYVNKVMDALNVPVKIVHICGKLKNVYPLLDHLHCDAFSMDSAVDIQTLRPYMPGRPLMGNVSTHAIGTMPLNKVMDLTANSMRRGADIVAPGCGLPVTAPLANVVGMTQAVRESLREGAAHA